MVKRFARRTSAVVLGLALAALTGAGTAAWAAPGTTAWDTVAAAAAGPATSPAPPCPRILTTAWGDGRPPFGHCLA